MAGRGDGNGSVKRAPAVAILISLSSARMFAQIASSYTAMPISIPSAIAPYTSQMARINSAGQSVGSIHARFLATSVLVGLSDRVCGGGSQPVRAIPHRHRVDQWIELHDHASPASGGSVVGHQRFRRGRQSKIVLFVFRSCRRLGPFSARYSD